jgi:hypothetical protein
MTEWWIWAVTLGIGWLASFAVEGLLHPRPRIFGRQLWTYLVHTGLWLLMFSVLLAIVQRPLFAALVTLGWWLTVVMVGNAKEASLREPFIFMDFEYFTDAIKHPRLYLPFLGVWRAVGIAVVVVGVVTAALWAEAPLTAGMSPVTFATGIALSLLAAIGLLWLGTRWSAVPSLDPVADIRAMGLAPSLWLYAWAERKPIIPPAARPFGVLPESLPTAPVPDPHPGHLVIVQSESFFDIRRLWPHIAPEPFADFDQARESVFMSGQVCVPPWGANTIRTEFSLLTGWSPASMGIHQFQPYRFLARRPLPTIAWRLRAQGYRTICIHPYPSSFYARNVIYPLLGFDQFIDVRAFSAEDRSGPYTGDLAVTRKAMEVLRDATQPTFIFIITMENHGPLYLESVTPEERALLLTQEPSVSADDLAIYLRHVRNAGAMLRTFMDALPTLPDPSVLAFYGDHVPILEKLYQAQNFSDGRTDYWLWSSRHQGAGTQHPELQVEDLGVMALGLLRDGPHGKIVPLVRSRLQ